MKKITHKKRAVISAILIAAITISGAFAYMAMRTGTIKNVFRIGSAGAQLIETFDGKTYEGKVDEADDGFANAVMSPGKTYEKTTKVKFTGSGDAYAFVKICIPTDKSENLVDALGTRLSGSAQIVTPNFNDATITTNTNEAGKWYLVATEEDGAGYKNYIYGYTTKLQKNEITSTSPLASVSVANVFINNNDFTSLKSEYLVPVTGYTIQAPDANNVIEAWNASTYSK